MPTPSLEPQEIAIKMILLGDSGTGKTGALMSLIKAGYRLQVLDYDGEFNSSWLINSLRQEKNAKELLSRVHYVSLRDRVVSQGNDIVIVGQPKAFGQGVKLLTHWKIGKESDPDFEDLGKSDDWGLDRITVIDSFSFMCQAAFAYCKSINTNPDERSTYFMSQQKAEKVLQLACSDTLKSHFILTAHLTYLELQDGLNKAFPKTIGKAFSPDVPKYFNSMLEVKKKVQGNNTTRVIRMVPDNIVDLKNPLPKGAIADVLPIETGLADFFKAVTGISKPAGGTSADKSAA